MTSLLYRDKDGIFTLTGKMTCLSDMENFMLK